MENRVLRTVAGVVAAGGLVVTAAGSSPVAAQSERGGLTTVEARGVFVENDRLAAKSHVLLVRNGRERRVSTNHEFRSGDRWKLQVETNRPAFAYVLHRTIPGDARQLVQSRGVEVVRDRDRRNRSGRRDPYRLLYPVTGGQPVPVRPNRPVRLPQGQGEYFRMDDQTGLEKIFLVLSEERIDIRKYFDRDGRQRTGRRPGGSGGGSIEDDVLDQLNADLASGSSNGQTAIGTGDEVESYGVVVEGSEGSSPFATFELNLKHVR